jgi:two-component system, cell cycle sensor histidine kinase and response regulator CckA
MTVASAIERNGYTVLTFSRARDALDAFPEIRDKVSAVILDVMMPEISGIECFEQLVRIQPDLPVIFMSGSVRESEYLRVLPKAMAFLPKPLPFDRILSVLSNVTNTAPIS